MFGKSFRSKYTGSLVGAGPVVFAVWDYMIAHAEDGTVDVNPTLVAATIGKMAPEDVEGALRFLASPDERSRSKEADGARIVQVGPLQWRLVNWEYYRGLHRSEQKRAADRERQKSWREKRNGRSVTKRDKALRHTEDSVTSPKAKPKKWTRVPEDWEHNETHSVLAAQLNVDLLGELAKFRDHEFKAPKTDADAAFRTWLRNAAQYSRGGPVPVRGRRESNQERLARLARETLAQEAAERAAGRVS